MSFVLNITFTNNNTNLFSNSTRPSDIMSFYNSLLACMNYNLNLMRNASRDLNLNTVSGKNGLVNHIIKTELCSVQALNITFPLGALSARKEAIKELEPTIFNAPNVTINATIGIIVRDAIFNTPVVQMNCVDDRLYIQNTHFNPDTILIINNRTLTSQEVAHISKNASDNCPISNMTVQLFISQESLYSESELRKVMIKKSGPDLNAMLLGNIAGLKEDKTSLTDLLDQYKEALEKCESSEHKIVNITCAESHGFDFTSADIITLAP